MDTKSRVGANDNKIEIKEEAMDFEEEYSENGRLTVLMKEKVCPNTNLKDEVEIKDEPFDITDENMENDKHFYQFSGLDESQTQNSDEDSEEKDFTFKAKSPSRSPPQPFGRNSQNITTIEKDEVDVPSESQGEETSEVGTAQANLAMRMRDLSLSRNFNSQTSVMHDGQASALLNKNVKNGSKKLFEKEISVSDTKKCDDDKTITCSYCSKKFFSKWAVKYHMCRLKCKNPFTCPYCKRSFMKKSIFDMHIQIHRNGKLFCGKHYNQKASLEAHVQTHMPEGLFKCSYCDKGFINKFDLETHVRTHVCSCSFCHKSFRDRSSLITHLQTHTLEKGFSCYYCGKSFNLSTIRAHLQTHRRKPI